MLAATTIFSLTYRNFTKWIKSRKLMKALDT